jgi:hypothetical protein
MENNVDMEDETIYKCSSKEDYVEVMSDGHPISSKASSDLSIGASTMELEMAYTFQKGEFGLFPAKILKGQSPNKQVIVAWLIFHMNQEGTCFPSMETLCKETGISSRTTILKCLKELETDGFIKSKRRSRPDGGYTSNEYTVFIRRQSGCTTNEHGVSQQMDTNHKKVNNTNINHNTNVANAPVEVEKLLQSKQKSEASVLDDAPKKIDVDFALLWAEYPNHKNKAGARKSFNKASKLTTIDRMLNAVRTQRRQEDWIKSGGQFVPMLSTWLNNLRWEDPDVGTRPFKKQPFTL